MKKKQEKREEKKRLKMCQQNYKTITHTCATTPRAMAANAMRTRRGAARHTDWAPPRRARKNVASVDATVVNA